MVFVVGFFIVSLWRLRFIFGITPPDNYRDFEGEGVAALCPKNPCGFIMLFILYPSFAPLSFGEGLGVRPLQQPPRLNFQVFVNAVQR